MLENRNLSVYNVLTGGPATFDIPTINVPIKYIPTATDIENGKYIGNIDRYFVKKLNEKYSYETNSDSIDLISGNIMWKYVKINWKIKGDVKFVELYNIEQVKKAMIQIPEIVLNIKTYTQFKV
jgi:hypothetical protein